MLQVVSNPSVGGLERVVESLAVGMAGRGHAVRVALFSGPGAPRSPLAGSLRSAGVEVEELVVPPRGYLEERRKAAALCRELAPDVVHTHGYRADLVDAPAALRAGFPIVTTVHGFTGGDLKNRFYEVLQVRRFRGFDAVVAVSRALAEHLAERGVPRDRVHTIQNGWRPGRAPLARAEARAALGVPADGFRIGFVGRLSREKGADLLVAAAARLRDQGVTASVLGDGRERAALEAAVMAHGLTETVTFHGVVPDAGRLMTAFDVLVMPSRTEGTPVALFEAMAVSTPIVATRVGGIPDVVRDSEAMLVPPEEPAALARAVLMVRGNPAEAAQRAGAARLRLEERFGEGPWLDAYERVYAGVAGGHVR